MDYNLPSPPSLVYPGILGGAPINVDTPTLRALALNEGGDRILIGNLTDSTLAYRGGQQGWVAVKMVQYGQERVPHNVRREASLLSRMSHHNVRYCLQRPL